MSAAESKMPVRIWITMEDHAASWAGAFRRWHASDLDHGDEYPVYIRADLVEQMAAALRASQAALAMMTAPKTIMATSTAQAYAHAYAAECKARAALSSWEAAQ